MAPQPWTVGNWRVGNESVGKHWTNSLSIMDADGGEVAVLTRGYEGDPKTGDGCPSWKNARLIAAAPDLLEALREVEKYMTDCGYFRRQEKMALRVRAAIYKARAKP